MICSQRSDKPTTPLDFEVRASFLTSKQAAFCANLAAIFSHFFQKYAFRSFTQFLVDIRIGHACKLLLDTDETIGQISYESGFNNLANFNRLFKKYRQCTPVEFRRRYLEKNNFDWTNQVTPWQFLPSKNDIQMPVKPRAYATRLVHV